jgi:hypothetical protein
MAEDWEGPSYQGCIDAGTVARAFEITRRHVDLSFAHHREVAALPPAEADALLDWCEETIGPDGKGARSTREFSITVSAAAAKTNDNLVALVR